VNYQRADWLASMNDAVGTSGGDREAVAKLRKV